MKPNVILFDEPFSFLDYSGIQEVLNIWLPYIERDTLWW